MAAAAQKAGLSLADHRPAPHLLLLCFLHLSDHPARGDLRTWESACQRRGVNHDMFESLDGK